MKLDFLQFKYNAFKVVDHYRKLFPNWSITDTFHGLNPGNPRYGKQRHILYIAVYRMIW